jgi:hypothetical protein
MWFGVELRRDLDLFTASAMADRVDALISQPSRRRGSRSRSRG